MCQFLLDVFVEKIFGSTGDHGAAGRVLDLVGRQAGQCYVAVRVRDLVGWQVCIVGNHDTAGPALDLFGGQVGSGGGHGFGDDTTVRAPLSTA